MLCSPTQWTVGGVLLVKVITKKLQVQNQPKGIFPSLAYKWPLTDHLTIYNAISQHV